MPAPRAAYSGSPVTSTLARNTTPHMNLNHKRIIITSLILVVIVTSLLTISDYITKGRARQILNDAIQIEIAYQAFRNNPQRSSDSLPPSLEQLVADHYLSSAIAERLKNKKIIFHPAKPSDPSNTIILEIIPEQGRLVLYKGGDGAMLKQ